MLSSVYKTGILGFDCGATVSGTQLKYIISGTDKDYFKLTNDIVSVSSQEAGQALATPTLVLTMDATKSTAGALRLKAKCPQIGKGWVSFAPVSYSKTVIKDINHMKKVYKDYNDNYVKMTTE